MPDIQFPDFSDDLSKIARDVADTAVDAAYVVIGASVLGFQRAQVQRQELIKRLDDPSSAIEQRLRGARSEFGNAVQLVDSRVEDLIGRAEEAMIPIEDRLPIRARLLTRRFRTQATDARTQLRKRILSTVA